MEDECSLLGLIAIACKDCLWPTTADLKMLQQEHVHCYRGRRTMCGHG